MAKHNPFKYFKTSPEIIRLAVMMYIQFPLSLRNVEDLLHERCIDSSAVRGSIQNNFNKERHLYSRKNYKDNRTAALAEWQQLCLN